jgi:hypothetical protein
MLDFFRRYKKQIAAIILTSVIGTVVGAVMAATAWVTIPVGWAAFYGFGFGFSLSTFMAAISCCCCRDDGFDDDNETPSGPPSPPSGSPHTYLPGGDGLNPGVAAKFKVAADCLEGEGFLPQDIEKLKEGLKRRCARMNQSNSEIISEFNAAYVHLDNINDYFEAIARICGVLLIKLMNVNGTGAYHESKQEFPKSWKPSQSDWQQYKTENKKEDAKDFNHRPKFTEIRVKDPNVNRFIIVEHKNPYEILGVKSNASSQEIERAFRKMIVKFHPDKAKNLADVQKGKDALAAMALLRDQTTKQEVDQLLRTTQSSGYGSFDFLSRNTSAASYEPHRQAGMQMNM